ncbi:MAG: translation initiation factor IF-3 [Spirochaetales bacterium]|nr:translation initiation factor IF-3 [Leptospiraceae bacterium]MCP5482735.1 translation initiation factor IF-3 [Spirochaetales bacterium]MCP5485229.1 translation initiation factor IF-3 [Spirochaetales bacterium]
MAKRRGFTQRREREKEPRINQRINAQQLRVLIEGQGQQVMDRNSAIDLARSMGLDLVEVSPDQDPPVCKIIDYGKYKYELQKKKKDQSRNQHVIHIKEVKLRPKIADNDYDLKRRNALSFLEKGDKVKVTLRFRGREITHPELGMRLMHRMVADLKEVSAVETPAKFEGRQIVMVLAPTRKKPEKKAVAGSSDSPRKDIDEKKPAETVTSSGS